MGDEIKNSTIGIVVGLVAILVVGGYFMFGPSKITGTTTLDNELTFKERCMRDGNMFMTMGPVVNGVPTGEPACAGCMIGNSHICDEAEYIKAMQK